LSTQIRGPFVHSESPWYRVRCRNITQCDEGLRCGWSQEIALLCGGGHINDILRGSGLGLDLKLLDFEGGSGRWRRKLYRSKEALVVEAQSRSHPKTRDALLLPGITAHGLPLEWLVIDTTPRRESSDHPLEELFQFSDYCGPSKLCVLPLRKPSQPPRMPIDTVDAQPGGTHKFHWNRHSALLKLYHILLGNWKYCNSIGAVSAKNRGEHPNKPLTHHRVSNQ
jgi:hypothetical protein